MKVMEDKKEDILWHQRFLSFKKALNELEEQGLIKAFEYTYELSWKTLQDLLKEKGYNDILGPKPVIEQSFRDGYIIKGKEWLKMHNSRNLTTNSYDKETADEIVLQIRENYFGLFKELQIKLEEESTREQNLLFDE